MSWFTVRVDPLTTAEADVLGLVDSGLSNREIAATLSDICTGFFGKLDVRNRTAAVARARQLGLL
jgi:LuxR family maltose regulon positive regulatory protein